MSGDNQQETEIGWLSGLIDTDGSISIRKAKEGRHPFLMISNGRKPIIETASSIIHSLGVGNHIFWHEREVIHKSRGTVVVSGLKRLDSLLPKIRPILKEPNAILLRDYINHRFSVPKHADYTETDYDFWKKIQSHPKQDPQRLHAVLSSSSDRFLASWLAGVIDGDGAIMVRTGSTGPDGTKRLNVDITIINTDPIMADAVKAIYHRFGSDCTVVKKHNGDRATMPIYHMQTAGYKRTMPIIEAVMPYIVGKREQAELVLELWNYRQKLPYRSPYGKYENEIKRRMQSLNHRGAEKKI